jgi:hypothetical protein
LNLFRGPIGVGYEPDHQCPAYECARGLNLFRGPIGVGYEPDHQCPAYECACGLYLFRGPIGVGHKRIGQRAAHKGADRPHMFDILVLRLIQEPTIQRERLNR